MKGSDSMPRAVSALTARTQFGQIMRRAKEEQERFVVDRRGEPQVVIMGVKDFLKTIAPESKALSTIRSAAKDTKKFSLSMREINLEVKAARLALRKRHATSKRSS